MDSVKEIIGKNIRIIRKQRGMTLKSLSEKVGISHQQLSRIETGLGTSALTLERIAVVLDVDIKTLIDKPESNLSKSVLQTKNFVPDKLCNQMYANLYNNVIKPTNDTVIDKFIEDIIEKLVKDKNKIRDLMYLHVGKKENYEFTPSEMLELCQLLFVDFTEQVIKLSKNNYTDEE